jgi:transposase
MVEFVADRADLENRIVSMHANGWGIRALARRFEMGRNTIRRILRGNEARRDRGHDALDGERKIRRPSKLDEYRPVVERLLEEFPDITGVRLHEELVEAGFDGGKSIVYDFLGRTRPRPKKEPVVRFETEPGFQGQMDWSPYKIDFAEGGRREVLCFSYILGHSRRQYADFTLDRKFHTLIRRHRDAFAYFGGVPRTCLYDGEKTVVLRREAGHPVFNPAFSAFATHYGFRPVACRPGRAQTKGKVEKPFQYIETNLLNGRKFKDFADLRSTARWWLAERNDTRIHATTGASPLQLFLEREKPALLPLPANPYDCSEVALRVCGPDGFVEHDTNFYSVPFEYVFDILTVKAAEEEIFVYSPDLVRIARHERRPLGAREKTEDPRHRFGGKARYGLEPVREAFLRLGGNAADFLDGLERAHPRNCGFQARSILRLKESYRCEDIDAALGHAVKYRAFDGKSAERILKAKAKPRTLESTAREKAERILENLPEVKQRPLSEYSRLLGGKENRDGSGQE